MTEAKKPAEKAPAKPAEKPAAKAPAKKPAEKKVEEKVEEQVAHPTGEVSLPDPPGHLPAPPAPPKKSGRIADGPDPVDHTADLEGHENWSQWRSKAYVHAVQMEENFVVTDADSVAHVGLDGDYLVVGVLDDVWVVPKEEFQKRFVPLAPAKA